MSSFNIIDAPWLDVLRTDGTCATLSLRELLTSAHEIARLSESSPLTEVALLRFLIALLSDGLREHVPTEDAWAPFAERCRDGLPTDAINAILAPLEGQSNVLDPNHDAFFDGPVIRQVPGWDDPSARQPVSRFLPELPTGTNLVHFTHVLDDTSVLCIACLLKGRAVDAAFARGGLGPSLSRYLLATIGGTEPRYVVPLGQSLANTLLLNLVVADVSRPSWASIHTRNHGEPGPLARLTWRPRLMMPLASSATVRPCMRCATVNHPRFSQAVMLDTYNHKGSPFGSKSDVERWKLCTADPHVLPFEKEAIRLGQNADEWPLRGITRLLADEAGTSSLRYAHRFAPLGGPVTIYVTSSSGNQAKIDGAPTAAVSLPWQLLARSPHERAETAAALGEIFNKSNRELRKKLIPYAVPKLLSDLSDAQEPQQVVAAWLQSGNEFSSIRSDVTSSHQSANEVQVKESDETDSLRESAKRLFKRLARLSRTELAALRPSGRGGSGDVAARQAAFEAVWYRSGIAPGARRHALREALATVGSIYAVYPSGHRFHQPSRSFERELRRRLIAEESSQRGRITRADVRRLVTSMISATPVSRDELLMGLVEAIVRDGLGWRADTIDFSDLLIAVACWNDPDDPTPVRWYQLLQSIRNPAFAGEN